MKKIITIASALLLSLSLLAIPLASVQGEPAPSAVTMEEPTPDVPTPPEDPDDPLPPDDAAELNTWPDRGENI